MPTSTDVNLPRKFKARFPSRCVACDDEQCEATIRLRTHTIGWWTWVLFAFGGGFSVDVPACSDCGIRIRIQRVGGVLVTVVVSLLFMVFVWPNLGSFVPTAIRKWVAGALILACLSPYILWEIFVPPAIDITAYEDSVDYEFRDPDYALDFAQLNEDADWVEIK